MEFSEHKKTAHTTTFVHQVPGGKSTISLGGGYGEDKEDKNAISGKIGAGGVASTAVPQPKSEEEEKKDEETKEEAKPASVVAAGARPVAASGAVGATQQ